jgi:hypothetical protein
LGFRDYGNVNAISRDLALIESKEDLSKLKRKRVKAGETIKAEINWWDLLQPNPLESRFAINYSFNSFIELIKPKTQPAGVADT